MSDRIWYLGIAAVVLQCLVVGLLIFRKKFGCFTPADREEIAKDVVRFLCRERQREVYQELDRLRRIDPADEENCA